MIIDSFLKEDPHFLKTAEIDTPLGAMIALCNDRFLYLLEFKDQVGIQKKMERIADKLKSKIHAGYTDITLLLEKELKHYFYGTLSNFKTPLFCMGSSFQNTVWQELKTIPIGTTYSYSQLAISIKKPTACRAVAKANSTNPISIIIPCHRVINTDGQLGGYAGGLARKKWLLDHENQYWKK